MDQDTSKPDQKAENAEQAEETETKKPAYKLEQADGEIGGPAGLEPTRYGDWERKGIVSDF
ncbi:MAG: succinate dehydrogenase assembly factor 4 [Sneathiella sp.]